MRSGRGPGAVYQRVYTDIYGVGPGGGSRPGYDVYIIPTAGAPRLEYTFVIARLRDCKCC